MLLKRIPNQSGFSIIELLIGLTIIALVIMLGFPGYTTWLQNSQIRTATESIQAGLQLARAEAVKNNRQIQFALTSTTPKSATTSYTLSTTGKNWVARIYQSSGSYTTADYLQGRSLSEGSKNVSVSSTARNVIFNALGRTTAAVTIDVTNTTLSSSKRRALRVMVAQNGQVRMCDPKLDLGVNPQGCTDL